VTPSARISDALLAHREAVRSFAERAAALPDAAWLAAPAPGRWSPAEITEHLRLTYAGLAEELAGGPGIRVRLRGFRFLVARLYFMPRVLRSGVFPPGVRAPREVVPADANPDRNAALRAFAEQAGAFERLIEPRLSARSGGNTHPFFGRLTPEQSLRFAEIHTRHHARQISG
jgi:hypothetical protein